jgi:DNA invertase Pin-like site-specific DNA recombinase
VEPAFSAPTCVAGRSLAHLIDTVRHLQERGVGFRSLQEEVDTTTSGGKLVFHVFGALVELSVTSPGSEHMQDSPAARARGRLLGRPRRFTSQQIKQLRSLARDERSTVGEICQT